MAGSYALPIFQDRKDLIKVMFGGWELSAVVRLASGTPFTIVDCGAQDWDFDGVAGGAEGRPVVVDPNYSGGWHIDDPGSSKSKMPPSAFRRATPGDNISMIIGRNTYFTDWTHRMDLGIRKYFPLVRGTSMELRFDAFNVTNSPQFWFPVERHCRCELRNTQLDELHAAHASGGRARDVLIPWCGTGFPACPTRKKAGREAGLS